MPNTAPALADLASSVTFAENSVNAAPQILDSAVTFTDPDDNFDTGTLTVTGLLAEDSVSIRDVGADAGEIGFSGGTVSFEGTAIGTATGGAGATLTVTFNADATATAIDALIENLTYANSSDTPTASRTLTVTVTDAEGVVTRDLSKPAFAEQTGDDNPFNGVNTGAVSYNRPALADLDGDGDLDAAFGQYSGSVLYFKNTGTAIAPVFEQQLGGDNPLAGLTVSSHSIPSFVDIDGDSDLDAFVGDGAGAFGFFRNIGTATAPEFQADGANNPLSGTFDGFRAAVGFGDIDGDGDQDALLSNANATPRLRFFENTGTALAPEFTEQTGAANPFDSMKNSIDNYGVPNFGDFDNDGDLDTIVGDAHGDLHYFENTGNAITPVFVDRTGTAASPFDGIQVDILSGPAPGDLDGDGDLDLTVGDFNGNVSYFQNTPAAGIPIVVNVTAESDSAPNLTALASSVTFNENTVNATPQVLDSDVAFTAGTHGFGSGTLTVTGLLAEDSVSVRDVGAGAGEIGFSGGTVSFEGTAIGTATGGAGATFTVTFNADATAAAIDALIENLTYANSSDTPTASRTLTVTVTDAEGAVTRDPASQPSFAELTGTANPFDGVDVGGFYSNSTPTLADLDGDGDLDAVVGENEGTLHYFQNTGSASAAVFTEQTGGGNPFDGVDVGEFSAPALADLDGDGDFDALVGDSSGALRYFQNTGSASVPVFAEQTGGANPFNSLGVATRSTPTFADLDSDGDLDAVVGQDDGTLNYFQNTGTASAPVFAELTGADNPFDGVDIGFRSAPSFADIDGDGDFDAIIGKNDPTLRYFLNTGTASAPVFAEQTGAANPFNSFGGYRSTPSFGDLDGDGDFDAVVGDFYGKLLTLQNTTPVGVAIVVNVTAEDEEDGGGGVTIIGSKNDDLVDATNTVPGQPLPTNASDIIRGNKGNDDLSGLGGGDTIDGGAGNDILRGGDGNDVLRISGDEGRSDVFDGGADTDTLRVYGGGPATLAGFDAAASFIEIFIGNGREIKGTGMSDVFDFSGLTSLSNLLFVDAKAGKDTLIGSNFADDLRGGKGNDILNGGSGDDRLTGGKDSDTFVFADGDGADTAADYKAGEDQFNLTGVAGVDDFGDLTLTQIDPGTVLVDFDGILGGDTLTIEKTTIATLNANQADFLFSSM